MAEFESIPSCHNDIDVLPTQKSGVMEFRAERLPPPNYSLPGLGTPKGAHFDPDVHLQLEPPAFVKDLNFKDVPFPYRKEDAPHRGNLAYTQPFRVLSDAGIQAAREAIFENQERLKVSSSRISHCVRGLGCVSNFHREMAHCTEIMYLCEELAQDELSTHTMQLNMSHSNVGFPDPKAVPVDKWHTDATDYVIVIILSDLTDMKGGELQVLQLPDSSRQGSFVTLKKTGVPPELVETVQYTGAGYGIFMQGSKILHTVKGVLEAREPRVSLVNSFMSTNVFLPDSTKYSTYNNDASDVVAMEYSRHKAWRVTSQLQYIKDSKDFISDKQLLMKILRNAAAELLTAANALDGKPEDSDDFI